MDSTACPRRRPNDRGSQDPNQDDLRDHHLGLKQCVQARLKLAEAGAKRPVLLRQFAWRQDQLNGLETQGESAILMHRTSREQLPIETERGDLTANLKPNIDGLFWAGLATTHGVRATQDPGEGRDEMRNVASVEDRHLDPLAVHCQKLPESIVKGHFPSLP